MHKAKTRSLITTLLTVNFLATITFGFLYSSLELYMSYTTILTDDKIAVIMGVFLALNYGFNLAGGYLASRVVSAKFLFSFMTVIQVVSCFLLLSKIFSIFPLMVLAVFVVSLGISTPCINIMLSDVYTEEYEKRERLFLWNYSSFNLAFTGSFLIAGYLQSSHNFHLMFEISLYSTLLALLAFLLRWRSIPSINPRTAARLKQVVIISFVSIVLVAVAYYLLKNPNTTNLVLSLSALVMVLFFCFLKSRSTSLTKENKNRISVYLILIFCNLVYWIIYQLMPTGMVFFINSSVHLKFFSIILTPQYFNIVNSAVVVLGGVVFPFVFLLIRKKIIFDIPLQFSSALLMMFFGLSVLMASIHLTGANEKISPLWIVLSYILQSIGELLIAPIGIAMIAKLAPPNYKGIMIGTWMLFSGVAALSAGKLSSYMTIGTYGGYSNLFLALSGLSLLASLIIFYSRKYLRVLINIQ